jgi:parvulin-like peptidyl-prolyl isomerase
MIIYLIQLIQNIKILTFILLVFIPAFAFSKSDFSVAYLIDDQIITNYDLNQSKRLENLLNPDNGNVKIDKLIIDQKIKEIYANRLKIKVLEAEFKEQLNNFLRSNAINISELKKLLNSKGIDVATFYNFIKANIRWQKVLDFRFGYKINNIAIQDTIPVSQTPKKIEKEYEFSEIFISFNQWDPKNAKLIANRLEIELNAGADFEKAVEKFSSADSKKNKGKVGPIKKSRIPKPFREILDRLKKNEVSKPFEINGGLVLLKLKRTRSYKTVKKPKLSVTFVVSSPLSNDDDACSQENEIRGPLPLSKVEQKTREILKKLMVGETYKFSDKNGATKIVTLCESFVDGKQSGILNFQNIKKNEEALRLSNALILELRRNTTVVKK